MTIKPALKNTGKKALDYAGIDNTGYLDSKGTPGGDAQLLTLPPGENIDDQSIADIRDLPLKQITPRGYPGDGWT